MWTEMVSSGLAESAGRDAFGSVTGWKGLDKTKGGEIFMSFIKVADKVRTAFKELEAKSADGGVTPQSLVKYAEPEDSPLHKHFEWNNAKAGYEFRVSQARQLLGRINVEVEDKTVREYQNIVLEITNGKQQGYYHISTIMSSEDLKARMMRQLLGEVEKIEKKYSNYEEILKILNKEKIEEYRAQYLQ